MLTPSPRHQGEPLAAHDVWGAWNLDPVVVVVLAMLAGAYVHGVWRRPRLGQQTRTWCFGAGFVALAVALVSPLDPLADQLASAHMVQHLLLTTVAPALLVLGRSGALTLAGAPAPVRRVVAGRRRLRGMMRWWRSLHRPVAAWLAAAIALWAWHAAALYEAALEHPLVHVAQHGSFLLTGVLFWSVILRPRRYALDLANGRAAILVFTLGMQNVVLALLLTFSTSPWYDAYAETTRRWGLDPLVDQQLAGAIMWVPAGLLNVGVGIALVTTWVRRTDGGLDAAGDWPSGEVDARPDHVTPGARTRTDP